MADGGGVSQSSACEPGRCRQPRADPSVLRALVRLASLVTTTTGEEDLVEAVAETARDLLAADSLSVSRMEPDGNSITTVINVGDLGPGEVRWPTDEVYRVADFPLTLAFLRGEAMLRWSTDVDDPAAEPQELALLRSLGKASSLKTPIRLAGEVWGELWASRGHGSPRFVDADVDLAEVIVALVAAGLAQGGAWRAVQAQASTDPMTGLANRRAFDEHLTSHLAAARAAGVPLALLVGDVNGLKQCNDARGHAAGDDALLHVAAALTAASSHVPSALAARLGGDEFALVLPGLGASEALAVAQHWCDRSRHPVHGTSLACGLAVAAVGEVVDARDLTRAADLAQYSAKTTRSPVPVLAPRPPRAAGA